MLVDRQRDGAGLDEQVVVGRRDEHDARPERLLVLGLADGQLAVRGQQLGERAVGADAAVLGDDDRRREVGGQRLEHALERMQPTPRRADRNDLDSHQWRRRKIFSVSSSGS